MVKTALLFSIKFIGLTTLAYGMSRLIALFVKNAFTPSSKKRLDALIHQKQQHFKPSTFPLPAILKKTHLSLVQVKRALLFFFSEDLPKALELSPSHIDEYLKSPERQELFSSWDKVLPSQMQQALDIIFFLTFPAAPKVLTLDYARRFFRLRENFTEPELKKSYHFFLHTMHPDKLSSIKKTSSLRREIHHKFKKGKELFEFLKEPNPLSVER